MANFFDKFKSCYKYKKIIPIIFAIDSSSSMAGERINHVNSAIKHIVSKFADYNKNKENEYNIQIAILTFSSGAQWITKGLVDPVEVEFSNIVCGGVTNLGCALTELNNNLSRKNLFASSDPYKCPFICFISDGGPTDNYEVPLKSLNDNKWYQTAKKVSIAIGEDVDCSVLGKVVGGSDFVIHLNSGTLLEEIIIGISTSVFDSNFVCQSIMSDFKKLVDSDVCALIKATNDVSEKMFDSDSFATTCAMYKEANDEFDNKKTIDRLSYDEPETLSDLEKKYLLDKLDEQLKNLQKNYTEEKWFSLDVMAEREPNNDKCFLSEITVPDGKLVGEVRWCPSCNNIAMAGFKFCPYCGMPIKNETSSKISVSRVQFSAIVPKRFIKGEYSTIDISVYEETYRNIIDRIIANANDEIKEVVGSSQDITDNTIIRIKLTSPDIELTDCEEIQKWQGRYLIFNFPVEIPDTYAKKQILFIATVYFNDLIATKLKFVANCTSVKEQKIQLIREDVLTAFMSYASQDRSDVATIIQGMKKARPDMDIFFDIESIRSGEYWESILRREIESRDILFLCWSNFAKNSEWVEKEWRYALSIKGLDSIEPIPLVSPEKCPPPDELKSKHFNDRSLLYKKL